LRAEEEMVQIFRKFPGKELEKRSGLGERGRQRGKSGLLRGQKVGWNQDEVKFLKKDSAAPS
jgi:hypothetical protein